MLPDFPSLKAEMQKLVEAKMHHLVDTGDPVLSQIKRYTQHEGTDTQYEQHGGKTVRSGPEEIGVAFEVKMEEIPELVGEKLDAKLKAIAQEITSKQAQSFFKKVGESCDEVGNTVDAGGKPITPELLLEVFSRIETEFDENGNPTTSLVIHPNQVPALKKVANQIENDPDLGRRNQEILERQREKWAARESNRKLVD